jgi:hypothetical protein
MGKTPGLGKSRIWGKPGCEENPAVGKTQLLGKPSCGKIQLREKPSCGKIESMLELCNVIIYLFSPLSSIHDLPKEW